MLPPLKVAVGQFCVSEQAAVGEQYSTALLIALTLANQCHVAPLASLKVSDV